MKKLIALIIILLAVGVAQSDTLFKGKIANNDLHWWNGDTENTEFRRTTSTGRQVDVFDVGGDGPYYFDGITLIGIFIYAQTPQTLSGAGAVNVTTAITWVVTTGANALTLADGAEGQRKFIVMKTDGGTGTLTPSHLGNGSTITFDDAGDCAGLLFTNGSWYMIGGTATLA